MMRVWLRRHAGPLAIVAGLILLFASITIVAVEVSAHAKNQRKLERRHEDTARAKASALFVTSVRKAEEIVIGSEREGCLRSTRNVIDDMNSWYEVDHADFAVAASPETKPESAGIRLAEAQGINRRELDRATRVDVRFAKKLASPQWRDAALKARFSCVAAYPLP